MKELKEIRNRLEEIIERQQMKLWRLARIAKRKGCSQKLVRELQAEGWGMYDMKADPERVLVWQMEGRFKYAFKAV